MILFTHTYNIQYYAYISLTFFFISGAQCPSGWYQDRQGSVNGCVGCPKDTYSPTSGNVAKLLCLDCKAQRTTRSSYPIKLHDDNKSTTTTSASAEFTKNTLVTTMKMTTFDSLPKIDSACFCVGTTLKIRQTSANQYTDSKFDRDLLKLYGSSCEVWDEMPGTPYNDYCPVGVDTCSQVGNWCRQKWCFVNDPVACGTRGFDVAGSTVFSPASGEAIVFYSYGVCGTPDCYANEKNWETGVCPFGLTRKEMSVCKDKMKLSLGALTGASSSTTSLDDELKIIGFSTEGACLCRAGLTYSERKNLTYDTCRACPDGANCGIVGIDRDGLTLQEILPLPGWWRTSPDSNIFLDCKNTYRSLGKEASLKLARERCCPFCNLTNHQLIDKNRTVNATSSTNGTNMQCLKGYTGPLCYACDTNLDYVWSGNSCVYCEGGASLSFHIAMWFLIGLFASFVVFLIFVLIKPPKTDTASKKRGILMNNAKVLWSWGQLFSSIPGTFGDTAWGASL